MSQPAKEAAPVPAMCVHCQQRPAMQGRGFCERCDGIIKRERMGRRRASEEEGDTLEALGMDEADFIRSDLLKR